ncbi:sensor histidine kinase [Bacillus sp. JJ1521]|uniref:cache domain-containing sensor histidine kinase n=1 Tax=Bacillus sp. JJ1521 TaxID=3122957 RepID=UPI002FFF0D01
MIKSLLNLSIKTKLMIFFTIIVLIPLVLLGSFTYQKSSEIVKEQVSEKVLERLIQINKNLTFFTKDMEQVSNYLYRNETLQEVLLKPGNRSDYEKYEDFTNISSLFSTVKGSKNWNLYMYVIGLNGDRYFTGEFLPDHYDHYVNNWGIFRKASEANGALVWDTHYTIRKVEDQNIVLSAGRLIKHTKTGEPLGYLVIDVMESTIAEIYQQKTNDISQLFLLDKNGYVISGYPSKATIGMKLEHPSLSSILEGNQGYTRTEWEKQPSILVYDTSENSQYKIATYIPESEVTKNSNLIGYITIIVAILSFLMAIWLSYFFSKTLTNPILRLNRLFKKVETGDLTVQYQSDYRDEIGSLGKNFNHMVSQLSKLITESIEKKTLLQEAEIKALRAQINPHFLYNTLETISAIAKLEKVNIVSDMSVALGEMMRYSIKKEQQFVPMEEDLRLVDYYLFIQKVRFQEKVNVNLRVEPSVKNYYIPPLLIQPLIENAINHGLEMKVGTGDLQIEIYEENNLLWIKVKDNGIGMDEETLNRIRNMVTLVKNDNHTQIGLENVRRRIELLFGKEYGLMITSIKNVGTTVLLKLPILHERGSVL